MVQSLIGEEEAEEVRGVINAVSVFDQVTPEDIGTEQHKNPILELVCVCVTVRVRERLKLSAMSKLKLKAVTKYLLQFDRLTFKQGGMHHLYISNDVEFHQMVLHIKYQVQVF